MLSINSDTVAGSVLIPGRGSYALIPAPNSFLRIETTDAALPLKCGTAAGSAATSSADALAFRRAIGLHSPSDYPPPPMPPGFPQGPQQLDILFVFTPMSLQGAGGLEGLTAQIDAAIAEANLAFSNSRVALKLNLAGIAPVNYRDSGHIESDLARLTDAVEDALEHPEEPDDEEHDDEDEPDEDYALRPVARLRHESKADLVCLLVEAGDSTVGVANQLWDLDPEFAPRALSVIRREYLNRYQILAHEVGHNLGCQHERSATTWGGVFPYSHAHRFEIDGITYRTVMATVPGIVIPHFSNPEVPFLGVPTGVPTTATNGADNARTLQLTAGFAAAFDSFGYPDHPPDQPYLAQPEPGAGFAINEYADLEVIIPAGMRIQQVDFYANEKWIGSRTWAPYRIQWTSPVAGEFEITAKVKLAVGETDDCRGVPIRFSKPPNVALRLLPSQTHFAVGQPVVCAVDVNDPDGQVVRVEYYAENYRIGAVDSPPFSMLWTNAWTARYALTARAIDNDGVSRTSTPYSVQIVPKEPSINLSCLKWSSTHNGVQLSVTGLENSEYRVECSSDLHHWTPVQNVVLGLAPKTLIDTNLNSGPRFYRMTPVVRSGP